MMMALLNNNADIFIRNNQGYSPIYFAASVAEAEVVDTMIRACGDFDVNAPLNTHGHTLLHVAAKNNNVDLIRVLLQKDGIKAHALDQCGKTPLDIAAESNNTEAIHLLLSHKETYSYSSEEADALYFDEEDDVRLKRSREYQVEVVVSNQSGEINREVKLTKSGFFATDTVGPSERVQRNLNAENDNNHYSGDESELKKKRTI